MRKMELKDFFHEKGIVRRVAALLLVCTMILTLAPATAKGTEAAGAEGDGGTFTGADYAIGDLSIQADVTVIPVIASTAVNTETLKEDTSDAARTIVATVENVEVLGLEQAAKSNAEEISEKDNQKQQELTTAKDNVASSLVKAVDGYTNTSGCSSPDTDDPASTSNIKIFSKVYIEITPKSYSTTDGEVKYELVITPKVQYIAATGNVTEEKIKGTTFMKKNIVESITVENDTDGAESKKGGAVLLADEELTVTTNTTITVPVPSEIVEKSVDGTTTPRNLIVKHELSNSNAVECYKAEVGAKTEVTGTENKYSYYAVTFNNSDGFSTFTIEEDPNAMITASAVPVKTTNPTSNGKDKNTVDDSNQTDAADATTDAAVEANAANGTENTADNAAADDTNGTSQKRTVIIVNPEVPKEEEWVAKIEESIITEEVAEVEGGDLTVDETDGGVIVENVGNPSYAWVWLIVALAGAGAILLILVCKRRKEKKA